MKLFRLAAIAGLTGILLMPWLTSCGLVGTQTSQLQSTGDSECLNDQARVMAYSVNAVCNNLGNYSCQSQTFSPGATASVGAMQECANLTGLGQICKTVDTAVIPTTGGNAKTIYQCSNYQVAGGNGYLLQASAGTLEGALNAVVAKCQSRSL